MKLFVAFFVLCSISQSCTPAHPQELLTDKINKVEHHLMPPVYIDGDSTWNIQDRMKHYGVPGLSIAVIQDNKIEWVKSYGVMDRDSNVPVDTNTLFQAGSISKPVAAYGALKLVARGKISLDSNINNYLKSWKLPDNEFTKSKKVTLRHLLSHTGGTTVHGFLGYSPDLPVPTLVQVLDGLPPANSPPVRVDKTPGESFRYSGGGISIEQLAMTELEGKPFPDIMQDLVLSPLGMIHSTYDQPLQPGMIQYAATGYLPDGNMTKGKRHTYPEMAAAGLWTTAQDLARFAIDVQQTYKGSSTTVHTQKMVKEMLTPFVDDFIGLGLFLDKRKDNIYFGHGGWDEGFSSQMTAHRDKGYGVVVLTNSNHPEFIDELIRAVAFTYGWDLYVPQYKKQNESKANRQALAGRFKKGNDAMIEIYPDGDRLMSRNLDGDTLEFVKVSDTTYISRKSPRPIQFILNPVTHVRELIFRHPLADTVVAKYSMMLPDEKLPLEYVIEGNLDKAFKAYQVLQQAESKDPFTFEDRINQQGYQFLNEDKIKLARDLFKINTMLHPKSANAYDSYAESCMKNKETELAILNYKKSLSLNPKNEHAVKMIREMEGKK